MNYIASRLGMVFILYIAIGFIYQFLFGYISIYGVFFWPLSLLFSLASFVMIIILLVIVAVVFRKQLRKIF
jgi:hypothetical protein